MPLIINKDDDELQFSMSGEFKFGFKNQPLTLGLVEAMMNAAYRAGADDAVPIANELRNILRRMPPN